MENRTANSRTAVKNKIGLADKDLSNVLPIHPYAALLLQHISVYYTSTARSMFNFIKNDEGDNVKAFQWFIDHYDFRSQCPYVTIDLLWSFFYENGQDKLASGIKEVLNCYTSRLERELIEEERRVLYVALTRAKEELIITRNLSIDFWIQENDIQKLKNNYFFKGFPSKLAKQIIHKESTNTGVYYQKHFYDDPQTKTISQNFKLTFSFKPNLTSSATMTSEEKAENTINPIIIEYMKTHKKGDLYPEDIKIAVVNEYIPNIVGFKKIEKKYGIDKSTIKQWVKI